MTRVIGFEDDQEVSLVAIEQYFRELRWIPELSNEEEARLFACLERGRVARLQGCLSPHLWAEAEQARIRLVEGYQRFVVYVASQYQRSCYGALSLEDLIQEGNLGLLHALDGYDASKGTCFGTYAMFVVRGAIRLALYKKRDTIRITHNKAKLVERVRQLLYELTWSDERVTVGMVVERVQVDAEEAGELLELAQRRMLSLQAYLSGDEDGTLEEVLLPLFPASSSPVSDLFGVLHQALLQLPRRQRLAMLLRYGLNAEYGYPMSEEEAAAVLGCTPGAVKKAVWRAKTRLRAMLEQASGTHGSTTKEVA